METVWGLGGRDAEEVEVDEEDEGWIPVILTTREPEAVGSSMSSAEESFSSVKESMSAMGLQPRDCGALVEGLEGGVTPGEGLTLQINSTSSRSMSLTARMLSLARKCKLRSLTASRRMDFWIRRTLHFAFLIFLTMLRR